MNTDMKRRVFLKGSLAAGTVGVAVSAGLLAPQAVMAAWPKAEFEAKKMGDPPMEVKFVIRSIQQRISDYARASPYPLHII